MINNVLFVRFITLGALLLVCTVINISAVRVAFAQTGLCPGDFDEGAVTIGSVECYDSSSQTSQRADAEEDRLELEAICLTAPRSSVTNSQIRVTSSGRFYAQVTCTIRRVVPSGTTLCPADAEEIYRAFDKVVCRYYGMAERTRANARATISQQSAECRTLGGSVLDTLIEPIEVLGRTFYSTTVTCSLDTRATDTIICPFGFDEISEDDNEILCWYSDRTFETLAEATAASQDAQSNCTDTTAGLGTVTEVQTGATSTPSFFASVLCTVRIARYGEFSDVRITRACDATCTEGVRQSRSCLNGGTIGGPGCTAPSIQTIDRRCNTGPDQNGLCPMRITPTIVPLLLLDEDDS